MQSANRKEWVSAAGLRDDRNRASSSEGDIGSRTCRRSGRRGSPEFYYLVFFSKRKILTKPIQSIFTQDLSFFFRLTLIAIRTVPEVTWKNEFKNRHILENRQFSSHKLHEFSTNLKIRIRPSWHQLHSRNIDWYMGFRACALIPWQPSCDGPENEILKICKSRFFYLTHFLNSSQGL